MFLILAQLAESQSAISQDLSGLGSGYNFTYLFVKVVIAMIVVCLGAIAAIKYLFPRVHFIKKQQDSRIEILERFTLEPKKNLYLIQVGTKTALIGVTENSMQPLVEIDTKELKSSLSPEAHGED